MATPQDNYIVPGRAGFIGQVGNIGSNNGLAGSSNNASIGGSANNGVQSTNAATSSAFALVKTVGGGSTSAASSSSFSPTAVQADVNAAALERKEVSSTAGTAAPAALGTNTIFPRSNQSPELPVGVAFNKAASATTLGTAGTSGKGNYNGIANTVAFDGESDLTRTQDENFNLAKDSSNDYVNGASPIQVPLYTPANEPGGQGPNVANSSKLAGNRSNSNLLPNSNG